MGKIRVFYFGFLTELTGKAYEEVVFDDKTAPRVEDVLDTRILQYLDRVIILVNDFAAKPGYFVKDGDQIKVLPHIGGG